MFQGLGFLRPFQESMRRRAPPGVLDTAACLTLDPSVPQCTAGRDRCYVGFVGCRWCRAGADAPGGEGRDSRRAPAPRQILHVVWRDF